MIANIAALTHSRPSPRLQATQRPPVVAISASHHITTSTYTTTMSTPSLNPTSPPKPNGRPIKINKLRKVIVLKLSLTFLLNSYPSQCHDRISNPSRHRRWPRRRTTSPPLLLSLKPPRPTRPPSPIQHQCLIPINQQQMKLRRRLAQRVPSPDRKEDLAWARIACPSHEASLVQKRNLDCKSSSPS